MPQSKAPYTEKNIQLTDQLHYTLAGSGSPALLFIHGWSCKRTYWNPQLEYFSNNHTVMAIDLPGYGDSATDNANNTISGHAQNVISAAKTLPSPVVLVGHSMGGAIALEAAQHLPNKQLAGVILTDTFLINYGILSAEEITGYYQPFVDDFSGAMTGLVENCCVTETPAALIAQLSKEMSAVDVTKALPLWNSLLNWNPATAFASLKAPIHAINCPLLADATRQRLAQYMSETVIPQTGHFLQMERPQEFNKILEKTLAGWCK